MAANTIRALFSLAIDAQQLNIGRTVDTVHIANVYVDKDDTHTLAVPFEIAETITDAGLVISLPPTTMGSVYHLRLIGEGQIFVSAYFAMPARDAFLSELELFTSYSSRPTDSGTVIQPGPAVVNWGDLTGSINNQIDLINTIDTKINTAIQQNGGVITPGTGEGQVDLASILSQTGTQTDAKVRALKNEIIVGGANLFDANAVTPYTKISPTTGETIPDPALGWGTTGFIAVNPSSPYTISGDIFPQDTFAGVAEYGINKNFIKVGGAVDRNIASVVFTPGSTTYFLRLVVLGDPKIRNRMINEGATALPYGGSGTSLKPELIGEDVITKIRTGLGDIGGTAAPVRVKEELIFTGDRHPAIYTTFPDSHTASDPRPIAPVTGMQMTRQEVYDWWDALVAEFPTYITKVLLGKDTSGLYDIFAYRFIPERPHGFNTGIVNTVRPRIMFAVTHIEQFNQVYPLVAMREMCRKWKTDPALAALRWECEIVAIPMAHPYGMQPGGDYRVVANGINVNGDFGYGWAVRTGALPTGAAPYATAETTHIKNEAERFKPHVLCDLHANSASDEGSGAWIDTENMQMKDVAVKSLTSMYAKHIAYDPLSPPINELLKITYAATFPDGGIAGSGGGSLGAYAYATGCIGGLCEFTRNYGRHAFSEGLYNRNIVFGTNLFLNYLVNGVASYRDNGPPVNDLRNPRPLKYGLLER